ncbi:MAG TPA: GntR family transcriptional regulator, partial [Mycobacterium sp.]|nr:GntR family transcriptional regulator [Mycobacterium sp.]
MNAPARPRTGSRRAVRREQLSDEVAARLRADIMTGALRPGTFIRLDETAAQLGVSITPVREALRTLRGEGMVQLEPHRGHVVVPLTRGDVEDIFWLQATIAKELAATAAERITDAEIDELERLNDGLAAAVARGDAEEIVAAEFAFHRAFNRSTGRIKLAWFLLHVARYLPGQIYAGDPGWGVAAVASHRELIAALRRRDVDTVVGLTSRQFTDAAQRLI